MRPIGRLAVVSLRQRGLTIVELMVTLAITGILLAVAIPSMREYIARQHVAGVAQELVTDLRYLRSARAQRRVEVLIDFGSSAEATCYVLRTLGSGRGTCDCTRVNTPICDQIAGGPVELKAVVLPRSRNVVVSSNPASLSLESLNGLPVNGVTLATSVRGVDLGGELLVTTNLVATPSLCSVSGHGSSLPACP